MASPLESWVLVRPACFLIFSEKSRCVSVHWVPDLANKLCLKGYNISRFSWKCYSFWLCRIHNYRATKHLGGHNFVSVFDWTLVLYIHPSKVSVSHLQAGHREGIYLEAAWNLGRLDDPFSSSILHPFTADVHQSQSQTSQLPHFWNALIMWTSRQLLLKYSPGVLALAQTTSPMRDLEKERGCWGMRHTKIPLSLVISAMFDHYS